MNCTDGSLLMSLYCQKIFLVVNFIIITHFSTNRLIKEVCDLQETMEALRAKIATAEGTHQTLLGVRAGLEAELRNKTTTLFIDRDQCMGLRRGYPVTAAIKS